MNHFELKNGALQCEGVPLEAIAQAVGTPAYVYSVATLTRHLDVFRQAFTPRDPLVAFAVKANANLAVIAALARRGAGADTVSAGEIKRALAAGVAPDKIIFSGVGKTEDELAFALEAGVRQINVESAPELALLGAVAARLGKRAAVAIRVNPDVGAGAHAKISTGGADAKFGVGPDQALALYAEAANTPALRPVGLAMHIGSQIRDLAPLEQAFRLLRAMAERLRAAGYPLEVLDLGGGLGVPYFHEVDPPAPTAYAAMVERVFEGMDVELAFEPGRLIAANAGVLLTKVVRIQERSDRRIVVVDAAMNDLIRPALYESYHDLRPVRPRGLPAASFDVVGPVCETGDTFTRDRLIEPLEPGDLAVFMTAGAYGAVMASTYNARALVPEVLVSGDRFAVVRRRWTLEEQLALESVPDWL